MAIHSALVLFSVDLYFHIFSISRHLSIKQIGDNFQTTSILSNLSIYYLELWFSFKIQSTEIFYLFIGLKSNTSKKSWARRRHLPGSSVSSACPQHSRRHPLRGKSCQQRNYNLTTGRQHYRTVINTWTVVNNRQQLLLVLIDQT